MKKRSAVSSCFKSLLAGGSFAWIGQFALVGQLMAGETAAPPVPNDKPAVAPVIPAPINKSAEKPHVPAPNGVGTMAPKFTANPNNEMLMLLLDMQNGDAAKRDAAGKALVAKGAPAYRSMNQFLTSQDADLVKRAKDIRTQIEQKGMALFQDANVVQGKALAGPLNAAALEDVRKSWVTAGSYAPQPELRQNATQAIQSIQMMMSQLEEATKEIAARGGLPVV